MAGHSPQGRKELDMTEVTLHAETQGFFFCLWQVIPVRIEHEGDAAAWVAGTLAARSVQGSRLP